MTSPSGHADIHVLAPFMLRAHKVIGQVANIANAFRMSCGNRSSSVCNAYCIFSNLHSRSSGCGRSNNAIRVPGMLGMNAIHDFVRTSDTHGRHYCFVNVCCTIDHTSPLSEWLQYQPSTNGSKTDIQQGKQYDYTRRQGPGKRVKSRSCGAY